MQLFKCCWTLLQAEQGCIHYQLYKEAGGDSGSFAMIETWATQVKTIVDFSQIHHKFHNSFLPLTQKTWSYFSEA